MTIERELTDDEAAVIREAVEASNAFSESLDRLKKAFESVLTWNLMERCKLEEELAELKATK